MSDAHDWVFDFALQFLESDRFDAAVMDFVDEKCDVFDSEEENKFIYSDIHKEFSDHIEALLTSNLGEIGITTEMFFESCEKAGQTRDINRAVFERILAMDDFATFKRIMVKRNMELQLLAMQNFDDEGSNETVGENYTGTPVKFKSDACHSHGNKLMTTISSPMSPEEEKDHLDRALSDSMRGQKLDHTIHTVENRDMRDSLKASLMEMELMHRREELESAELAKAVAMSLAIEEERINTLKKEAKENDHIIDDYSGSRAETSSTRASSGGSAREMGFGASFDEMDDPIYSASATENMTEKYFEHSDADSKMSAPSPLFERNSNYTTNDSKDIANDNNQGVVDDVKGIADLDGERDIRDRKGKSKSKKQAPAEEKSGSLGPLKPLKVGGLSRLGALPAIPLGRGSNAPTSDEVTRMAANLEDKKKEAESLLRQNREQLAEQRAHEENLRTQINRIDPNDALDRAKHMRDQRDRLIAMKKAERDKKVQEEREREAKNDAANPQEKKKIEQFLDKQAKLVSNQDDDEKEAKENEIIPGVTKEEVEEGRRGAMRNALARRMKMALAEAEETPDDLDLKLKQVESARLNSKAREQILNDRIRNSNIKYSV